MRDELINIGKTQAPGSTIVSAKDALLSAMEDIPASQNSEDPDLVLIETAMQNEGPELLSFFAATTKHMPVQLSQNYRNLTTLLWNAASKADPPVITSMVPVIS